MMRIFITFILLLFININVIKCIDVRNVITFGTAKKGVELIGGEETLLYEYNNAGTINLMWFTGELLWLGFGYTDIRIYIDNATQPQIEFDLLMSVGVGYDALQLKPWGNRLIGALGTGSIYNNMKIPFQNNIKITAFVPPDSGKSGKKYAFYFCVRGNAFNVNGKQTPYPIILNGQLELPTTTQLKLQKVINYVGQPNEEILVYNSTSTSKGGLLYMVQYQAASKSLSFLEGRVRAYIDSNKEPMLLSSGTEDYFLSAQYFDLGTYQTPLAGCTLIDRIGNKFSAYRIHDDDPIVWQNNFGLTIRIGDGLHKDTSPTTIITYVWAYEWN